MVHDGSRFHHSWSQIPSLWVLKFSNDIFMIFPHEMALFWVDHPPFFLLHKDSTFSSGWDAMAPEMPCLRGAEVENGATSSFNHGAKAAKVYSLSFWKNDNH